MAKKLYITTAIHYVNASPHLGHLYEEVTSDVFARWARLKGDDVFFLTGTDENAQKVARVAKEKNIPIKKFVDSMAKNFVQLCKVFNISNDDFIRTTEERHINVVQKIFEKMYQNGDIYKGHYDGLYCYGCESFYQEKELNNLKCKIHDKPVESIKEESYFFKLSKYQKRLLEHYEKYPDFILPQSRRSEIINRVKEGLKDISVSRHKLDWGIPITFDNNHRTYVWKEALENYISALGYPDGKLYKKFWPCDYHFIGVDINFFHSVIWPAILLSLKVELPKHIFVHGFVNIKGGKMSKSKGTVIDPFELAKKYQVDAIRYFLLREIPFGDDGDFSEDALKTRLNNELANDLGNLVSRSLSMVQKNLNGKITKKKTDPKLSKKLKLKTIETHIQNYQLHHALEDIWKFVNDVNRYINEKEPWKATNKEELLYTILDSIRVIAILLHPFIPSTSENIFTQLGITPQTLDKARFGLLTSGNINKGKNLFTKIE